MKRYLIEFVNGTSNDVGNVESVVYSSNWLVIKLNDGVEHRYNVSFVRSVITYLE